jgi:adenylylsulfate kinase
VDCTTPYSKNVTWFDGYITRAEREALHGHKGAAVWFTGLSASGKSTIGHYLERMLYEGKCSTYALDGDNVRHGLCRDLGFSPEDRKENIRRIGEMVRLFVDAGIIAITAFISPYRADREVVKKLVGEDRFLEVYVQCPVEVCAKRDPKGLYQRAMAGVIKEFTGVSAPYEAPENPSLVIHSDAVTPVEAAEEVIQLLKGARIIAR